MEDTCAGDESQYRVCRKSEKVSTQVRVPSSGHRREPQRSNS